MSREHVKAEATRLLLVVCSALAFAACHHAPIATSSLPPVQATTTQEADALVQQRRPERFKMVHQVAAAYQGQSGVMQGYLLGRRDGSFRVSATAALGPRLFDAAKLDGKIQTRVHFKPIAEKLDVAHIARAIDRIYFLGCGTAGEPRDDAFVARCPAQSGDDVDEVEVTTSARTLEISQKRFFLKGAPRLTARYEDFQRFGDHWAAKRVSLTGADGYTLTIALEDYVPNFPFDDALLKLD